MTSIDQGYNLESEEEINQGKNETNSYCLSHFEKANPSKIYFIENESEAENKLDQLVQSVKELTNLNYDDALKLLIYYKWNGEKISSEYFIDESSPEKIKIKAGIISDSNCLNTIEQANMNVCEVCGQLFDKTQSPVLRCGHLFCINCWKDYLLNLKEQGNRNLILTP